MVIVADTTNLAVLLSLNRDLEPIPEPFRMQKEFAITIPFYTFCDYMRKVDLPDKVFEVAYIADLKECLINESDDALKYYYNSLARAQLKELCIAESYDKVASIIIPQVDTVDNIEYTGLYDNAYVFEWLVEPLKELFTKEYGYTIPDVISDQNLDTYGLVLYYMYNSTNTNSLINVRLPFH